MRRRSVLARLVCASAFVALSPPGAARSAPSDTLASPHTEHSTVILGAKGLLASETSRGETELARGAGAFLETTVWHDRLELELSLVFTTPGDTLSATFEPLVKVPLHLASFADGYAGGGAVLLHDEPHGTRLGAQAVVGSYFWFSDALGVDVDLTFAALPGHDGIYELALGLGPVARF
ncbi:MAG: hypothetical protein JWN48_385 [Myxococcaceae bacterium]|nr:hypothetical protein [Myxococcaceae bacterium]